MKFSTPALTLALTLALALVPPFALGQECSGEDYDHGHSGYSDYDECACDGSDCVCVNDDSTADSWGTTCSDYTTSSCSGFDDGDFTAADQCCHCGGGTTTFDIPDFTTHSDTMGYCYSTWNEWFYMDDYPGVSTIGGAWAFCAQQADAQGKTLVAMDSLGGESFNCQDACDCMVDVESEWEVVTLASIPTLPAAEYDLFEEECSDATCTGEDYDHALELYSAYDDCACDGSDCVCVNDDSTADSSGTTCSDYTTSSCSGWDDDDFTAADQCCHCGGGTTGSIAACGLPCLDADAACDCDTKEDISPVMADVIGDCYIAGGNDWEFVLNLCPLLSEDELTAIANSDISDTESAATSALLSIAALMVVVVLAL